MYNSNYVRMLRQFLEGNLPRSMQWRSFCRRMCNSRAYVNSLLSDTEKQSELYQRIRKHSMPFIMANFFVLITLAQVIHAVWIQNFRPSHNLKGREGCDNLEKSIRTKINQKKNSIAPTESTHSLESNENFYPGLIPEQVRREQLLDNLIVPHTECSFDAPLDADPFLSCERKFL